MTLKNAEYHSNSRDIMAEKKHLTNCIRPFLGLIYAFLSSFSIIISSVIVKKMTYISTGQLSLVRNAGILVWNIPIAVYTGQNLLVRKSDRLLLTLRCFAIATALYLNILAYRLLPLAEVAIILSTTPAVAMIAARLYLKESCSLVPTIALVLTVVGVVLSARVPELIWNSNDTRFSTDYMAGMASAIVGVFCFAFASVTIRKMKATHFSVMLIYTGFLGIIENGLLTATFSFFEFPKCGWDSILMMTVGLFGFAGHVLYILSIQVEAVGIVTTVRSAADIIIALVFQVMLFSDHLDVYSSCGALIVIVAVSAIGVHKWVQQLSDDSKFKRKFKFMLL